MWLIDRRRREQEALAHLENVRRNRPQIDRVAAELRREAHANDVTRRIGLTMRGRRT